MNKALFACLLCLFVLPVGSFAVKPAKFYAAIPDTMHVPYEKNTIITPDNVSLKSWTFLPAKGHDKKVTLVLAYADAGNMSWWATQASTLAKAGYTVLLFDYRGFGESDAFAMDTDVLFYNEFVTDLSAAMTFARARYPQNKTGILCYSMGTIIATLAASKSNPDFIIGEGYVTNVFKLINYWAVQHVTLMLPPEETNYATALANLTAPMLIFSGTEDKITTDASVQELRQKKPYITIKNFPGGHMFGFWVLTKNYPGSEYVKVIDHFLKVK